MVLKIAAGVFIGILGVLAFLKIPDWLAENREAEASHKLYRVTPDVVIQRCGSPLKDKSDTFPTTNPNEPLVIRSMFYNGKIGTILVEFSGFTDDNGKRAWNLVNIKNVFGVDDPSTMLDFKTDHEKIDALPCLGAT